MEREEWWEAAGTDSVGFGVLDTRGGSRWATQGPAGVWVTLLAGDPQFRAAWLSPAEARRAAVEWPVILLRLADEAERASGG